MFETITRRFSDILGGVARKKITEKNIKETLREIRVALLEADVSITVIKDFLARVEKRAMGDEVLKGVQPGQQFIKTVYDEMVALMAPVADLAPGADPAPGPPQPGAQPGEEGAAPPERTEGFNFHKPGPTVILMAGLQGSGKTTTCGKLALRLRKQYKKKPLLVAADVQRPAAIEQLQTLGNSLGIPVWTEAGKSPPEICKNAVEAARSQGCDTVILDTAGRLHIDEEMMGEVKEVARLTKPHEVFLVCDAMVGQDAVKSAREFNEALELTGVILTKLDGDARGGAALSVRAVTGKPIRFIGVGEKLEGTLEEFRAEGMASRILGMGDVVSLVSQVEEHVSAEERQAMQDKLLENTFTLEDFLGNLKMLKKMGSMRDLLAKVPGIGAQIADEDIDESELVRIEGLIQSMTPKERQRPEILNTSRRDRIARGAGVERVMVDDLVKQFSAMKKMMGGMTKAGGKGPLSKLKALGQARQKMGDIGGMMQDMMEATAPPDAPGMPSRKPKGSVARQPSRDELRERKKKERQNRKKNRKKNRK